MIGVDAMTDYYDVGQKRSNLADAVSQDRFEFVESDISDMPLDVLDGVDVVHHQSGQPGVRASWQEQFGDYLSRNVQATQRLLEGAVQTGLSRFVYASSSSVYGNAEQYPVDESIRPRPFSPYGVTKLAAEHMCSLYAENFGLSTVSLRYFTVYGPRQRPDMATHRLFEAALNGTDFPLFGTGEQMRDFTFVGDVVRANLNAGDADVAPGLVANIAGGGECSMNQLIEMVEQAADRRIRLNRRGAQIGDVGRTGAVTDLARRELGWEPEVDLATGLARQCEWHLSRR